MDAITTFIENSGQWMYVLAPLFMVAVAILPFPAEIPAMLNGMVFGPVVGIVVTWSGAMVGAVISFELARRYGRPLAEKAMSPSVVQRGDQLALSAGWPGLLVLRLIPTIAFTAINWIAGLTRVKRWMFFWTTAIGILPGGIVFTLSGTGLAMFYRQNPQLAIVLVALGLFVLLWTTYRFRRSTVNGVEGRTTLREEESLSR